ncbi:CPBP family intramembrane glutamic endopeptidase [Streptomyces hygroscopicus]|uniref:CPBP family intramembrane glutamic endopeptidase n=1 Tax=Streptomyces hygroscopicus TaxID=1912 RepID=UPI0004C80E4E|nr:CPBP family intramembrane glutamic endopeptidase [Streptomyces hygroscopicus]
MQHGPSAEFLSRRQELAETGVFLLLIMPSMALSFLAVGQGRLPFSLAAVATVLRDVGLVALILLLLSRGRQTVAAIGWVRRGAGREIAWGIVLSAPVLVGMSALAAALRSAGLSGTRSSASGLLPAPTPGEVLLAVALVAVVAVAEETIFRGYLILRFASVLRSRPWAVVLSSAVFSVGHGYEGGAGVLTVGTTGLVFAVVYLWRRSLLAPIVMHFSVDLVGIVLVPLLPR